MASAAPGAQKAFPGTLILSFCHSFTPVLTTMPSSWLVGFVAAALPTVLANTDPLEVRQDGVKGVSPE
jgi:hypothetical protein